MTPANLKADDTPAIRVEGLRKTFGSDEAAVTAVDDISFDIEKGSVVGLLGPNGAGKTTTIKSMLGLVVPDAGTVEIAGVDVYERPDTAYENVGAILEGARNVYWRLTVRENLAFFAGLGGDDPDDLRNRHDALLEQFDLTEWSDTTVNELSRGMKQKVSLATTLARDVDVVFMDEPTLGLDIETSLELRSELRQLADREDVTIVLCSHDMDVIEDVCDRMIVLNEGAVIEYDTVDALLELFQTCQYEITVRSLDEKPLRRQLERSDDVDCTEDGDSLTISVTETDGTEIYDVIGTLEGYEPEIRNIRTVEPDLEEVFLRLVSLNAEQSVGDGAGSQTDTTTGESETQNRATFAPTGVNTNGDR